MQPQTQVTPNQPLQSNAAGPGAFEEQQIAPKPVLEGANEYEYVTILNPLTVDFWGKVAVTRPVNAPIQISDDGSGGQMTLSEEDVRRNYGLNLRNKDHMGRVNVINRVCIPAGKTINILGSEAQVIVRQLVTEILARENKRLMLADPFQRHQVEQRIVLSRRSVNDLMDGSGPLAVQEQLQGVVDKLNITQEKLVDEPEFPDLRAAASRAATTITSNISNSPNSTRVFVGRPKGSKNRVTGDNASTGK